MSLDPRPTDAEPRRIAASRARGLPLRDAAAVLAGEVTPLRLVMPMPPALTNASGRSRHWRTVNRARQQYYQLCDVLAAAERWPKPPASPFERATLSSVMYLGHEMDEENAAARHKWPIDWLVDHKYLADDRRSTLRWVAFPEQVVRRGQRYRLELTLTPITESP